MPFSVCLLPAVPNPPNQTRTKKNMPPDGPHSLAGAPRRRIAPHPPGTREGRATGEPWLQPHWTAWPWACCVGGLPVGCWERRGATWPTERTSWRRRFFTASSGKATKLRLIGQQQDMSASDAGGSWLNDGGMYDQRITPPVLDKHCRCVFSRRYQHHTSSGYATLGTCECSSRNSLVFLVGFMRTL